jgi:hypothetical protein
MAHLAPKFIVVGIQHHYVGVCWCMLVYGIVLKQMHRIPSGKHTKNY